MFLCISLERSSRTSAFNFQTKHWRSPFARLALFPWRPVFITRSTLFQLGYGPKQIGVHVYFLVYACLRICSSGSNEALGMPSSISLLCHRESAFSQHLLTCAMSYKTSTAFHWYYSYQRYWYSYHENLISICGYSLLKRMLDKFYYSCDLSTRNSSFVKSSRGSVERQPHRWSLSRDTSSKEYLWKLLLSSKFARSLMSQLVWPRRDCSFCLLLHWRRRLIIH